MAMCMAASLTGNDRLDEPLQQSGRFGCVAERCDELVGCHPRDPFDVLGVRFDPLVQVLSGQFGVELRAVDRGLFEPVGLCLLYTSDAADE